MDLMESYGRLGERFSEWPGMEDAVEAYWRKKDREQRFAVSMVVEHDERLMRSVIVRATRPR